VLILFRFIRLTDYCKHGPRHFTAGLVVSTSAIDGMETLVSKIVYYYVLSGKTILTYSSLVNTLPVITERSTVLYVNKKYWRSQLSIGPVVFDVFFQEAFLTFVLNAMMLILNVKQREMTDSLHGPLFTDFTTDYRFPQPPRLCHAQLCSMIATQLIAAMSVRPPVRPFVCLSHIGIDTQPMIMCFIVR